VLVVDSHRDLDRKNTIRALDGRLLALDWDAAGPAGAVQEAVTVALDWAWGEPSEAEVWSPPGFSHWFGLCSHGHALLPGFSG
jgi:hypothetical protein